jgi:hypothetical protein
MRHHAIPGLLKHVLDSYLKEHSQGGRDHGGIGRPFGGTRVVKIFNEDGELLDPAVVRRTDTVLGELIWMAKTLRHGQDSIPLN